jgi:lipid II:glycine glycyltransferase (peptidoglycan interpeptide bridge formation enzyme)
MFIEELAEASAEYRAWVQAHPQGTLWQSAEWAQYQKALKRSVRIMVMREREKSPILASALITIDQGSYGLSTWDIPRGPLFDAALSEAQKNFFLDHLRVEAKKSKALCCYFSPLDPLSVGKISGRHIQPEATRITDLSLPEAEMLAHMKQKGRYNIKVAEKNTVTIEQSGYAALFHQLLVKTAERDGFTILPRKHYETFLQTLPGGFLLLAYHQGEAIAGLMGVTWGKTGIYYYGASSYEHRALMAPYLLQWEAMKFCKRLGCTSYDLLGIAPPDAGNNHPWSKISEFKEKFGGEVVTYPAERMIVLRPMAALGLKMKRKVLG